MSQAPLFPTAMNDRQVFIENTVTKSSVIPPTKSQPRPATTQARSTRRDSHVMSSNAMMKGYMGSFLGGMACAAVLIWNNRPIVIPETNVLVSPHPHLTPGTCLIHIEPDIHSITKHSIETSNSILLVYYRVFILNHPFYSPYHATPDDNTLGRFFLVDIAPPFTGQRITDYIIEREHLRSQEVSLYANTSAAEPVSREEIIELVRGVAPLGNPDEPLMLVLEGKGREGSMEAKVSAIEVDTVIKPTLRTTAARAVARLRIAPARVAGAAVLFVVSLAIVYAVSFDALIERARVSV